MDVRGAPGVSAMTRSRVGGLGTREDFFRAYEKASGTNVDPESARFWEVFGNLRWGIITISQARTRYRRIRKERRTG